MRRPQPSGDGRTQYSTQPPQLTLALSEASPHAHVDGPAVYYSPASGAFSVTAQASAPGAGLDEIVFPNLTPWHLRAGQVSDGASYEQEGAEQATVTHTYILRQAQDKPLRLRTTLKARPSYKQLTRPAAPARPPCASPATMTRRG